jgi:gamma-glutamylaminecyclotransferase
MGERVFVYGTLMRAQANHRVLVGLGARLLGDAVTCAPRTLVDLGPYPALLAVGAAPARAAVRVHGELYTLGAERLAALDAFEGCPDLYRRARIAVDHAGAAHEAWTYELSRSTPPGAVVVASGRYAGGGIVLRESALEADTLDKSAEISDVSPPRRPR